jgi:hypothetical protein
VLLVRGFLGIAHIDRGPASSRSLADEMEMKIASKNTTTPMSTTNNAQGDGPKSVQPSSSRTILAEVAN